MRVGLRLQNTCLMEAWVAEKAAMPVQATLYVYSVSAERANARGGPIIHGPPTNMTPGVVEELGAGVLKTGHRASLTSCTLADTLIAPETAAKHDTAHAVCQPVA